MSSWISVSSCWALAMSDHSIGKAAKEVEESMGTQLWESVSGKILLSFSVLDREFKFLETDSPVYQSR